MNKHLKRRLEGFNVMRTRSLKRAQYHLKQETPIADTKRPESSKETGVADSGVRASGEQTGVQEAGIEQEVSDRVLPEKSAIVDPRDDFEVPEVPLDEPAP